MTERLRRLDKRIKRTRERTRLFLEDHKDIAGITHRGNALRISLIRRLDRRYIAAHADVRDIMWDVKDMAQESPERSATTPERVVAMVQDCCQNAIDLKEAAEEAKDVACAEPDPTCCEAACDLFEAASDLVDLVCGEPE